MTKSESQASAMEQYLIQNVDHLAHLGSSLQASKKSLDWADVVFHVKRNGKDATLRAHR